jgi:ketosteroid isomerase-like protein
MKSSIAPEQVRAEIQKFWQIMCGKSGSRETLDEMYSPSALVVSGKARKPEAANVALARRARQISAGSNLGAELGPVEVQVAEPGVAIASYTYKFHQSRSGENGGVQKRHTYGRATQIFQLDQRGVLRIVHEHLSAAANPEVEKAGSPSSR